MTGEPLYRAISDGVASPLHWGLGSQLRECLESQWSDWADRPFDVELGRQLSWLGVGVSLEERVPW